MSNQEVQFNLIVLTTRGNPQFILESESTSQDRFTLQVLPQVQARKPTLPDDESIDGQALSELVNRQSGHVGGWTIRELTSKE